MQRGSSSNCLHEKKLVPSAFVFNPKRTIFFSETVSIMNRLLFDLIFCMTAVRRKFLSSSWSGQQLVRLFFSRRRRLSVVLFPLLFSHATQSGRGGGEKSIPLFPLSLFLGPNPNSCLFPLSLSLSFRPFACLPPPTLLRRFEVSCRIRAWGGEGRF